MVVSDCQWKLFASYDIGQLAAIEALILDFENVMNLAMLIDILGLFNI